MKNRKLRLFMLATGILSAALVAISYLFGTVDANLLFNSDSMYLPMLFDDVFRDGGNFFSWYLTPAPGFFPDMTLFFMARSLVKNTFLNFLLYATIQVSLSYIFGLTSIRIFEPDSAKRRSAYIIFCTFFLVAIACFVVRGYIPYVFVLLPVYRFGAIFNLLILSLFVFSTFKSDSNNNKIFQSVGIFLTTLLGSATDLMFLLMAVIPAMFSLIIASIVSSDSPRKRNVFLAIAWMISGTLIGLLLKAFLITTDTATRYINLTGTSLASQLKILISFVYQTMSQNPFIGLIIFVFYVSIFSQLVSLIISKNYDYRKIYLLIFLILSPLLTSVVVLLNGILTDWIGDTRYIYNFYWQPIFFSWVALSPLRLNLTTLKIGALSFMSFSLIQIFPIGKFQMDYYPHLAKCIDETIIEYQNSTGDIVDRGLALYWEAKLVSHFSKQQLSILQVLPDLSPFLWINNPDWYKQSTYDFAVFPSQDNDFSLSGKNLLLSINGEPKMKKTCSSTNTISAPNNSGAIDNIEVLIYGSDELHTELFTSANPKVTIKGCSFLTHIGVPREEDCAMSTTDNFSEGYLIFGPYLQVSPGTYRAEIDYDTNLQPGSVIGDWDIAVSIDGELEVIFKDDLIAEENSAKRIANFDIPEKIDPSSLQVRASSYGIASLGIVRVTIEKI